MRILIVEDEPVIAQRIERLTRVLLGARLMSIECAPSIEAAERTLRTAQFSLLLLDLNLSGADGFEILRRAAGEAPDTIVISANTDRALEAFELGVVDFVAKPFTQERLSQAFERIDRRSGQASTRYLACSLAGKVDLVPLDCIVAIHGDDDYSNIETTSGRRHLHKKTLTSLERMLPESFQRVHRSHIVNFAQAERIISEGGGKVVVLKNGSRVPIGRAYSAQVEQRLL